MATCQFMTKVLPEKKIGDQDFLGLLITRQLIDTQIDGRKEKGDSF